MSRSESPSDAVALYPKRVLALSLAAWPLARFLRAEERQGATARPADRPFALVAAQQGGRRVVMGNAAARHKGIAEGQLLTNALAVVPDLATADADPRADRGSSSSYRGNSFQHQFHFVPWHR